MTTELHKAIAELRKKQTDLKIGPLSDFEMDHGAYSTGNLVLDTITSIGGFPKGRIVELSGKSMSGKTTAAIQCAVEHQRKVQAGEATGAIMYLDYEHALDEAYADALGLDVNDSETFIYLQPDDLEEGANAFRFLMSKGVLAMCIFDSVAAAVPRAEKAKETGAVTVADRAKALHQFFRQITSELKKKGVTLILINHVMEVIETGNRPAFMPVRKTRPGGTSIEYYSSMRIEFTKVKDVKTEQLSAVTNQDEKHITQQEVLATVFKNKLGLPQRTGIMRVRFGKGFSQPFSVFQALVAHGIVKKRPGGYFDFPEELAPSGYSVPRTESAVVDKIESDPEWLARLVAAAEKAISEFDKNSGILNEEYTFDPDTGELLTGETLE